MDLVAAAPASRPEATRRLSRCTRIPHVSQLQSLRAWWICCRRRQRWQAVEAMAREHFQRSGFGEIRTPLLERPICFAAASVRAPMWWAKDVQL